MNQGISAQTTPRPLTHFTPPKDWINDPNGLVLFNDLWHLFYQYQPGGRAGKHWGHAVSRDLIGWEDWPVALWPDELGEIWSGSCVIDWNNSSSFFPDEPGLVAIFTHRQETADGEKQSQSLAFSRDEGRTWTKFAGNPVLESERSDFRDPKVFWHAPTQSWIMIVAAGSEAQLYRSPDLQTWTYASCFGAEQTHGLVWECPDLFALRDEQNREIWILISSFLDRRNFEGSFQDCFAAYFAGDFDGFSFSPHANGPSGGTRLSFGPDDYAPVSFAGAPDNRRILMGWLNHWGYAGHMGTAPWQGQMTLPRELLWRDGALVQTLPLEWDNAKPAARVSLDHNKKASVSADSWELVLAEDAQQGSWVLEATRNEQLVFSLRRDAARNVWAMQRAASSVPLALAAKTGGEAFWTTRYEAPLKSEGELRVIVDRCSVEAFCDGGRTLFCLQIFPPQGEWHLRLSEPNDE
ncbi:MAG TPA: glycoside hydrolase family 32 protein [Abditibacteriaceae bacterium]|nr:glycoside hydrolase family 32 protein [Abditibacteriaceae bacterium]